MDTILTAFSNLAVPVACLIAVFFLWDKERDSHDKELAAMTTAVQNNTLALQKLIDKLER